MDVPLRINNQEWVVSLTRDGERYKFQRGWIAFARANGIISGQRLIAV
ncbi:hypothetical protein ACJIZ3_009835 [Penstemon smallii]|uniref:TF-B3 domain-containing protein n=1 Tax=Penstemon smallii TaxID=265156 RepID=A0ABD3TDM3_9LAMI